MAIDPAKSSTVYVDTGGVGLNRSTDGGQTWSLLMIPTEIVFNGTLAIDPKVSGTLYVSDFYAGVLKTSDGGQNWRAFTSGLPATGIEFRFIAVDPQNSS